MYRGVAIWNYAGDAVENAERFHKAGFDAISWNAPLFVDRYNDDDRERVAEYLKRSGQYEHLITIGMRGGIVFKSSI